MSLVRKRKGSVEFSSVAMIIIALIAGLAIIAIVFQILGAFTDVNKIKEGIKCRVVIQTSSTLQEATQGLTPQKLIDACPTIQKLIPLRDSYPTIAKSMDRMNADMMKQVVIMDFAELINNVWWITGEGDRSEYLLKNVAGFFTGTKDCYVVYAVRIHTPKNFTSISENDLLFSLKRISRADLLSGSAKGDQRSIMEYITLDGKGSGVWLRIPAGDVKIEYQENGADPLFGIAVGFAKESGVNKLLDYIFNGKVPAEINKKASFIYIAPYQEVASLCRVV
jgi:hypothetical protein